MNGTSSSKYVYGYELWFERYFDLQSNNAWLSSNFNLSFYWTIAYVIVIFGGRKLMKNREPYCLRSALIIWNLCLAIFSIVGTIRVFPEVIDILREEGFTGSVCNNRMIAEVQVSNAWIWLFCISKVFELMDTVFIVLRKQKLIFLHWYHHITVLIFSWYTTSLHSSTARWNCIINLGIHSLMYSYYAIRAMNISVPKRIALLITSSQIIQMVFGIIVMLFAVYHKSIGNNCNTPNAVLYWGLAMYFSYFILFVNFFVQSYLKPSGKQKKLS